MSEHDLFQVVIAATYILSIACLAVNRYIVGLLVGLAGIPAWWFSASANGEWGFQIVTMVFGVVYVLGIIGRWPRRAKTVEALDEHDSNRGI